MHDQLYGGGLRLEQEDLSVLADPSAIEAHLRRIRSAIATDPEHAIGVSKELIESTVKLVLHTLGEPVDEGAALPKLIKAA